MGLLDNYSGIGMSPRPKWQHQIAMSNFMTNAAREIRREGLLVLTEATVTDDWDDLAPDLVIFDKLFNPLTVIEITRTEQLNNIIYKCEELMERFPDSEYFVYDYEHEVLCFYDIQTGQWATSDYYELRSTYLSKPVIAYFQ
ncbi:MAG: hypothetical protein IJ776_05555 [Paludibacteraceae bacterium]|nr:hypothetical protein [Paludibacteraceae bacterium]